MNRVVMKRLLVNGAFAALVAGSGLAIQSAIAFGAASSPTVSNPTSAQSPSVNDNDKDKCKKTHPPRDHGPDKCDDDDDHGHH
jgi:hypothetical protein